jgi:hypothetical protein
VASITGGPSWYVSTSASPSKLVLGASILLFPCPNPVTVAIPIRGLLSFLIDFSNGRESGRDREL